MDNALHFLTIGELGAAFRRGEVSPVEAAEAFLERIDRLQGRTSAYITVTAERARADAKAAEAALRAGNDLGPLHGIPVALKDLFETAGIRTTAGSKVQGAFVPDRSCTAALRLARAGAVLLGKTNMVEFAFGPYGLNPHYGTPANPWDAERVPGGSSSGSGVAVAAGLAAAALGTDTGGSVRIPASYCGIVGLKTTVGRVSRAGVTPLSWTLDSVGPMTRCVEDAALVFSALAGPDPADPPTLAHPVAETDLKRDVKGMRVGVVRAPFFEGADAEVVARVEAAVRALDGLGVHVEEMDFPEAQQAAEATDNAVLMRTEGYAANRRALTETPGAFDPRIRDRLMLGAGVLAADYIEIVRRREGVVRSAARRLAGVDAVVGPTMLTPAPRVAEVELGEPGRLTTRVVNWLGLCAVSVPCGLTSRGLPVGLQVIGKAFDEETVLRLAYAYEQTTQPLRPPGF